MTKRVFQIDANAMSDSEILAELARLEAKQLRVEWYRCDNGRGVEIVGAVEVEVGIWGKGRVL